MRILKSSLRKIIREALDIGARWSLQKEMTAMLERDYDKVDENTRYPYGRNRGDVRSTTKYTRKDGQPIQPEDIVLFEKLKSEQDKDSWAALSGVYWHELEDDNMTLVVKYYRHTSG